MEQINTKALLDLTSQMNELEIWCLIYKIESELFWSMHETRTFDEDLKRVDELNNILNKIILTTKKFDVEFTDTEEQNFEKSNSYMKWYQYWHNYIFNIDETQKKQLEEAKRTEKDVDVFLPDYSWKDTPITKIKR